MAKLVRAAGVTTIMMSGSSNERFDMSTKDVLADIGSAGVGVTAAWTWVAHVNDVLQLVATAVAIVAGFYAIKWHRVRIDDAEAKRGKKDVRDEDTSE